MKGKQMKATAIFIAGLVAGWLLLWQIQDVANTLENQCILRKNVTKYDCKQEIQFAEFVYNVK